MSISDEEIATDIFHRFYRKKVWGKHHWREETLTKSFPPHIRGRVMKVAEELRKKGFLIKFPTSHGMQWYANIEKIEEIKEIINV